MGHLQDRIKSHFNETAKVYFFTLTERLNCGRKIKDDFKRLRDTLNMRRKRQAKRDGTPFIPVQAFYVPEYTHNGELHLHGLWDVDLTKEELSQDWRRATDGISDQVDNRITLDLTNPAGYILKYLRKDIFSQAPGTKHYQFLGKKMPFIPSPGFTVNEAMTRGANKGQCAEPYIESFWNTESKYYPTTYEERQQKYGPAYIEYMESATLTPIQRINVIEAKLNLESEHVEPCLPEVKLSSGLTRDEYVNRIAYPFTCRGCTHKCNTTDCPNYHFVNRSHVGEKPSKHVKHKINRRKLKHLR
jgi:hypothetical protein